VESWRGVGNRAEAEARDPWRADLDALESAEGLGCRGGLVANRKTEPGLTSCREQG